MKRKLSNQILNKEDFSKENPICLDVIDNKTMEIDDFYKNKTNNIIVRKPSMQNLNMNLSNIIFKILIIFFSKNI